MKHDHSDDGEHWLSVSDMMSGLMVIFLFIAISYMMQVQEEKKQLIEVAVTYEKTKDAIYTQLHDEFKNELPQWNAVIDRENLAISFQEPDVLFNVGDAELKDKFKIILNEFFPRYNRVLANYYKDVEEIRIEGHTSSEWNDKNVSSDESYFLNMKLSQDRTRSTLEYCLMLPQVARNRPWLKTIMTANGLSSSKPVLLSNGQEDTVHSRRVEFKVKTNSEKQILKIFQRK
ncbi:MAG: OmpA family protein [Methylococcales bacterium]|nr:OmpA family protein [Methylococcales bacterium]MDP3839206.1 OmpA family protein [Methylococcales bacterium]